MDDLISPLRAVSATDPALDLAEMDLREYVETRDEKLVRELPGRRARRFHVRPLSVFDFTAVMSRPTPETKMLAAVELGLVQVEGLEPGVAWQPSRESEDAFGRLRRVCGPHDLQHLFARLGSRPLLEMGALILERAEQGNAGGGAVRFTVPPLLLPVLEQSARLHAARSRTSSETPSSDSSSSG